MPDRLIRTPLYSASRCPPRFGRPLAKNLTPHQAAGLAYERKVRKALEALVKSIADGGARCEYQPWFTFVDGNGVGACAIDFLIRCADGRALVVECKLTYLPTAPEKLRRLYIPVAAKALNIESRNIRAAVICKNLAPTAVNTTFSLSDAFALSAGIPTIQWLGHGPISW